MYVHVYVYLHVYKIYKCTLEGVPHPEDKDKESEEKPSESKAGAKPEKSGPWMLPATGRAPCAASSLCMEAALLRDDYLWLGVYRFRRDPCGIEDLLRMCWSVATDECVGSGDKEDKDAGETEADH